ncbi:hypothetical protein SAMN05660662_1612 [Blastococcus aurantiacus]|uniref:AMIN-like domain-containing protein n=1 Tax=Blastococcus aurantiacus TaxID=1550231 RepID=A0A1G7JN39_9ACTN|nr:hypothetical protein [Blastococcus aurantiacus]SDF26357.1 hypothetical protein SAMN05660662_1612 [Blastococcus aurantiacus]
MSRHWIRRLTLTATVALAASALPATAQAAPYCGLAWGSLPEVGAGAADTDMVVDVRSGRHACYDRLVVDLLGQDTTFGSYDVRYVPRVVEDGSGRTVPVRGAADLQITLQAQAYDGDGNATFTPADRREVVGVGGYRTFRQVAWAGSYEGSTTLALGVRARLPFRVMVLPGVAQSDFGPRLVIDVAHRW